MKKIFFFLGLYLLASCTSKPYISTLEAEEEFERARGLYENGKYTKAIEGFERIIFFHPSSEFVDDAQYWLARAYFEEKDYDQAAIEYDYLIRNFRKSPFLEEAYLNRAKTYFLKAPRYYKDQTELNAALNLLDEFLTMFPNSKYTNEAREMILVGRDRLARKEVENGKLYIKLGQPDAALLYFNYVVETYPETKASNEAKYYTATLYENKGRREEAINLYKELLEDETWKGKAEERIKKLGKEG